MGFPDGRCSGYLKTKAICSTDEWGSGSPMVFSLRVQHAACPDTPSLHFKYFRGRRRITALEMNALIR